MNSYASITLLVLIVATTFAQKADETKSLDDVQQLEQPDAEDLKPAESTSYYTVPFVYSRYSPYYGYYYPYYRRPFIGYGYRPYVGLKAFLPYGIPLYG
ncbi:hypothetical protein O3M35_003247 [Rhynocoris fuscipes]|uniref:Uncharacterized protein n=1 Tax=Rhynocoris fuscipes TaxID=488301 RepID=A0AAW1CJT1_9HEMI